MSDPAVTATFVFTDIEGSTRLWEREPEAMRSALAQHDAICRDAVGAWRGRIVKTTGDGIHAVFGEPLDALQAVLEMQLELARAPVAGIELKVRAGLHLGPAERRDGDYYGPALNRAARIMAAAHGGQVLLSQTVADAVRARLPAPCALLDLGTARLRDLDAPEHLQQLLHPALRAAFPPLRALARTPSNLPQALNRFVGRERELAEARELLARSRLLTLLGMGGMGKSRLSLQLAATLLDEYPDGVWLVELAPLVDGARVPQVLAGVLGLAEERGRSLTETLLHWVRERRLLIVLDNCEHVLHACAELAKQLLQAAAGVRLLASSRDTLKIAGETVYPVPALSVPAPSDVDGRTSPAALLRHEGVQLFVERARAVQPAFALEAGNVAAVAAVCRTLDGIPLALELAAARVRTLSVQAISRRLVDRFALLKTDDRTVLPRQRTLRALIDWSHELLSEPECLLFARLAVFAGGWTLESAEAVTAGNGLQEAEVLDLLGRLVEKSLVVLAPGGERYLMLDTVHAYAAEKLDASGDATATRRRHVEHFLRFAAESPQKLSGPEQAAWLHCLDAERDNLLAAHVACGRDAACRDAGLELVFVLKAYWRTRGLLELGHRVTLEALARTRAEERDFGRCRVLCDAGQLCCFLGRFEEARRHLEESRAIAHELGDAGRISAVMQPLGMAYLALGDRAAAQALYEATLRVHDEAANPRVTMVASNSLAQLHRANGDFDAAGPLYARVIALARTMGDHESMAIGLLNQAMMTITRGDTASARGMLAEVREIARTMDSEPVAQSLLEVLAGLAAAEGDGARAAWLYGSAEARSARNGIRRDANDDAFLQPLMAGARAASGEAVYTAAERDGRSADDTAISTVLGTLLDGRV
ncbi:MAG: tetratricopeptide repeat protein [Burkholderiales bacterium]|nr:tetratricopeptide repeat protein [Burkholderiales bacterium]